MQYKKGVEIEVLKSVIAPFKNIIVADDCIATGGTIEGTKSLVSQSEAKIAGVVSMCRINFYNEQSDKVIGDLPLFTLISKPESV